MRAATWVLVAALASLAPVACADELSDGIAAVRKKDYYNAVRLLMPLAQAGNAQAQLQVGDLYYHGHGVKESDEEALRWYEQAARQGLSQAQFQAGNMYAYGLGTSAGDLDVDRKAALYYFEAARQGHRDAQYGLAILILAGKGVERDEAEAYKWMKRAADQGHEDARRYVSR
jgi:TPR repeat protein